MHVERQANESRQRQIDTHVISEIHKSGKVNPGVAVVLQRRLEAAQVWGPLRVPHHENELDKQIAAIALVNDLTVVTRNTGAFQATGVRVLKPFD